MVETMSYSGIHSFIDIKQYFSAKTVNIQREKRIAFQMQTYAEIIIKYAFIAGNFLRQLSLNFQFLQV